MMHWKIASTLTDPEDPEWERLAKLALGTDVHPDRKSGFLLSREALKNALRLAGESVTIDGLNLSNHHKITRLPQFTISLSHTKDIGVALVADGKIFRSVGIDIEHEERLVKEMIKERISHPEDENYRNIELWCLKEAAFKTLMNTELFEKPLEFSSIKIGRNQWFHSPSGLSGEWKLERLKPFVLAVASLKN